MGIFQEERSSALTCCVAQASDFTLLNLHLPTWQMVILPVPPSESCYDRYEDKAVLSMGCSA